MLSQDEMFLESKDLSVKPLAKLLHNAGSLTLSTQTNAGHKQKLRPEVIDVHRLKDVGTAQPVSFVVLSTEIFANMLSSIQVFRNISCLPS